MLNLLNIGVQDFSMAALGAFIASMAIFFLLIGIAIYVYFALTLSTIAKKLGYEYHWLAWIPVANLFLYPILAKKHWALGFLFLIPIANVVLYFVWKWQIYELRNYPGWLSLVLILSIVPLLNVLAFIAELVIVGLVAWKDR
ncbi:MAG: hypothetical protein WCY27_01650 [archaeon]|jgi:hypothetical protein|nr:hypothetical protein [archaeon]MDD2477468.1 hypothetical protein [Candidatus ainarchaeum sp.]MDD3084751.1 hypothetical protein [Candidatus ainarchaeum sp.]MDD4221000.1 hypothetical protein [Candidatus ainarchaeum sp.]MDD4662428.1 hypothetical protein [Candidatus ainarchaeum sp.]